MVEHTESEDGLHHVFRARTKKTFDQFKKDANYEMGATWASFLVTYEWRDRVVHISSPASGMFRWAYGTGRLEHDVVTMELTLEKWPATSSWVRNRMLHDVERMTAAVSAYSNLQQEEFEARHRLRGKAVETLQKCRVRESNAVRALARWSLLDDITRVLVAVTGTGSAFAVWSGPLQPGEIRNATVIVATAVAGLGTIQAVLKASEQIKEWAELKGHFVRLKNDLESFINELDIKPDFVLSDSQQRLQTLERRYADGEVLWRTDALTWFFARFDESRSAVARLFRRTRQGAHRDGASVEAEGSRLVRPALQAEAPLES